ncbi:hypothetical protein AMQ84_24425 [Paenibacillus riograndensis]|uniref:Lipoprotein n=1 Tax=Paenibacillus riograndensis TaxID=483937 RepID=A0A132TPS8_9BACL|nr:hypothetical protein [Paenibacillus riograndensis]KWX73046.1 hypothetical protein AMQ84_24425 [Paenibacillus riograndensis]KWX74897.1 hypothetical protein AMQ83_36325 [Paenibacillus riograndensis]
MDKPWRKRLLLALIGGSLLLLAGCEKQVMYVGSSTPHQMKASYLLLSGTEKKTLKLKKGDILYLSYASKVEKGELSMKLYDPDHKLFKELETNKKGEEEVEIQQTGSYKLEVVGDGAKGSYKVSYKTELKSRK